jgi:hypothetical protein
VTTSVLLTVTSTSYWLIVLYIVLHILQCAIRLGWIRSNDLPAEWFHRFKFNLNHASASDLRVSQTWTWSTWTWRRGPHQVTFGKQQPEGVDLESSYRDPPQAGQDMAKRYMCVQVWTWYRHSGWHVRTCLYQFMNSWTCMYMVQLCIWIYIRNTQTRRRAKRAGRAKKTNNSHCPAALRRRRRGSIGRSNVLPAASWDAARRAWGYPSCY